MSRRKILVTLDGSDTSRQILPIVRRLFAPDFGELLFLRVAQPRIEPPTSVNATSQTLVDLQFAQWDWSLAEQEWNAYYQAIEDDLKTEAEPLRKAGYTVHIVVEVGTPVEVISHYIDSHQINLLAMATHGRRGLSKLLFGSVTEEVLRRVSTPILVIRPVESDQ